MTVCFSHESETHHDAPRTEEEAQLIGPVIQDTMMKSKLFYCSRCRTTLPSKALKTHVHEEKSQSAICSLCCSSYLPDLVLLQDPLGVVRMICEWCWMGDRVDKSGACAYKLALSNDEDIHELTHHSTYLKSCEATGRGGGSGGGRHVYFWSQADCWRAPDDLSVAMNGLTLTESSEEAKERERKEKKKAKRQRQKVRAKMNGTAKPKKKKKKWYGPRFSRQSRMNDTLGNYLDDVPKMKYETLEQYCKEVCFYLCLKKTVNMPPITTFVPQIRREEGQLIFDLSIPYTDALNALFDDPRLRDMGKCPFRLDQTIFMRDKNDESRVWTCTVSKAIKTFIEGSAFVALEMVLCKWNDKSDFDDIAQFSIVAASPAVSRVIQAMSRLKNKTFVDMILCRDSPVQVINESTNLSLSKSTINQSQKDAIQHSLDNPVTLIQGPPGTGKTSTIYEIILQTLQRGDVPIVVVAQSNVAIDNLAEKLMEQGKSVLRVISAAKEREYNSSHHIAPCCLHLLIHKSLPNDLKRIADSWNSGTGDVSGEEYGRWRNHVIKVGHTIVEKYKVICCTSVAAGGTWIKTLDPAVVIMDESTQSSEATSLIPLSLHRVKRFVFVGDQKQLSSFSNVPYLEQSMFERLIKNQWLPQTHMLDTQYRMHPAISAFPSQQFYDGKLKDGVTAEQRTHAGLSSLRFLNSSNGCPESSVSNTVKSDRPGYTKANVGEAKLVIRVLRSLIFQHKVGKNQIGIITPYAGQRDLIADMIQQDSALNPSGEKINEETEAGDTVINKKPPTIKTIVGIMVSSVDAFQGREKDFILFSCVRSNPQGDIGFVKDQRRMNVGLTRARKSLVIIGDAKCLSGARGKGQIWSKLIDDLTKRNLVRNYDPSPSIYLG